MKIPFDIKYRPQIEAGKYKVVTRDGRDVRILCWDADQFYPICAQFRLCAGTLIARYFDCNGIFEGSDETENGYDLFLVPAEPELTDFEKCVKECLEYDTEVASDGDFLEATKEYAKELLALARKEIEKDLPRWKKADRDWDAGTIDFAVFHKNDGGDHEDWLSVEVTNRLYKGEYYIELSALEKLPKEDEK